jgi:hypothetical protein
LGWICGKARISVPGTVRFICLSAYAIVFPKLRQAGHSARQRSRDDYSVHGRI